MPEISSIGVLAAFAAGVVSFLSPCVLPLVPGYVCYVAGQSIDDIRHGDNPRGKFAALRLSAFFVLGFSTVFVVLGASATAIGQLFLKYRYEANIVSGALIVAFGLLLIGLVRPSWLQRDLKFPIDLKGGHPVAAYVLGLAFAFAWTPCIGPVLGAILTVSATTATVEQGIVLLAIYSLGLGLPFLAAAAFTRGFMARLRPLRKLGRPLQVGTGAVIVLMGLAVITGRLSEFSYWLLDTFPVLAKIG